ncbi:hypothetical protein D3C80_788360 [compost metagenome]
MVRFVIGGVNEQLHMAVDAVPDRALAVVRLLEDLLHKAFNLGQHFIDQIFTGVEIVEHGGNRDFGLLGNFGMSRTANAATGKYLDGTFHQLITTSLRRQPGPTSYFCAWFHSFFI